MLTHRTALTWQPVSLSQRVQEKEKKTRSFCNLISEVISHLFCYVLVVRVETMSSSHSRGGGYTQAVMPTGENHRSRLAAVYHSH